MKFLPGVGNGAPFDWAKAAGPRPGWRVQRFRKTSLAHTRTQNGICRLGICKFHGFSLKAKIKSQIEILADGICEFGI